MSTSEPAAEIVIPDRLNMVQFFLDARLDEGLGDKAAIHYHGDPALAADPGRTLSYAELVADSCRVTNLLRELGLGIEDRVLILMPDTPAWVAAYFGILRAGCVAVPANAWLKAKDYAYYLEYARPKAVIVDASIWPAVDEARRAEGRHTKHFIVHDRSAGQQWSVPAGTVDLAKALRELPGEAQTEPTYRDDFSTWLSSSGSTGNPKCVVHMHHDFVWNTIAYAQRTLKLTRDDRTLAAPKLFFGYALASNMLFPLSVGGSCVLLPHRVKPADYFELLARYEATQFVTVPTTIAKMVAAAEEGAAEGKKLDKLHSLISAGEALPARVYRSWRDRFGAEIYDGIGSAEMFHVYITNRPGDVKEGSLGKIVEGYDYELRDDAGKVIEGTGEIGTLVIKGPSAGLCYWRMRDKSRATFQGDAVVGGDKFMLDADGYFWYCGRGDDMLKCSGVYVSPVEVENALIGHPAVRESGVVGYRDDAGLEKTMAFVEVHDDHRAQLDDEASEAALAEAIIEHCRGQIAAFKAPRRIEFVDDLPRTETGKIRRAALRELAKD
ncbi:Benzoate-CoA ligase family protein [Plesiocystis pacifica SIR-1]|uniref:Benzoate-CoA ligase family protein n=1 Tax=Plesiocystis pacifica SIR-1 TaxID=391625 RepID=A6G5C8_9BACT|nr:benzoate-CoA ligase family protein [Plesiocystis pacifica]EDM78871.1 Benzoate-CoA ligase family protein [Plesiocystis pacifica SIR-1]